MGTFYESSLLRYGLFYKIIYICYSGCNCKFSLQDVLLRMNLKIENTRGQCYDGVAAMAGTKTGVATQIKAINSKCLYTHCYGHALNLAVADSIKSIDCLKSTFEIGNEICKLIKKSHKRST